MWFSDKLLKQRNEDDDPKNKTGKMENLTGLYRIRCIALYHAKVTCIAYVFQGTRLVIEVDLCQLDRKRLHQAFKNSAVSTRILLNAKLHY